MKCTGDHVVPSARRLLTPRAGAAVLLALAGLLSAACATTRYTQSALAPAPPTGGEARASKPDTALSLSIERVKLRVETTDRAPRSREIPRLGLRVTFDPPELGYAFDRGEVVLRGADGREWRAHGGGYVPVFPKAAFELWFDAVVPEGETFDLVLGGLARGARRLDPVTLRLSRRGGRSIDRVYWLELLLAPLAYGY